MSNFIIKSNLTTNKNFYILNKKISEIKRSDVKFIKENFLDKGQYHLVIKIFLTHQKQ